MLIPWCLFGICWHWISRPLWNNQIIHPTRKRSKERGTVIVNSKSRRRCYVEGRNWGLLGEYAEQTGWGLTSTRCGVELSFSEKGNILCVGGPRAGGRKGDDKIFRLIGRCPGGLWKIRRNLPSVHAWSPACHPIWHLWGDRLHLCCTILEIPSLDMVVEVSNDNFNLYFKLNLSTIGENSRDGLRKMILIYW